MPPPHAPVNVSSPVTSTLGPLNAIAPVPSIAGCASTAPSAVV
jgi:hypothetical protein